MSDVSAWTKYQLECAPKVITTDAIDYHTDLKYVIGCDISFSPVDPTQSFACVAVLDAHTHAKCCVLVQHNTSHMNYPSGYLAFREVPAFKELIQGRMAVDFPDATPANSVLIIDGNGIWHPRAFGSASHVGFELNWPSIGVAKTPLFADGVGEKETMLQWELGPNEATSPNERVVTIRGISTVPSTSTSTSPTATTSTASSSPTAVCTASSATSASASSARNGRVLGVAAVFATQATQASNPVFISIGHMISLETAIHVVREFSLTQRECEAVVVADAASRAAVSRWEATLDPEIVRAAKAARIAEAKERASHRLSDVANLTGTGSATEGVLPAVVPIETCGTEEGDQVTPVSDLPISIFVDNSGSTAGFVLRRECEFSEYFVTCGFGGHGDNACIRRVLWNTTATRTDKWAGSKSGGGTVPSCFISSAFTEELSSPVVVITTDGEIDATEVKQFTERAASTFRSAVLGIGLVVVQKSSWEEETFESAMQTNISCFAPLYQCRNMLGLVMFTSSSGQKTFVVLKRGPAVERLTLPENPSVSVIFKALSTIPVNQSSLERSWGLEKKFPASEGWIMMPSKGVAVNLRRLHRTTGITLDEVAALDWDLILQTCRLQNALPLCREVVSSLRNHFSKEATERRATELRQSEEYKAIAQKVDELLDLIAGGNRDVIPEYKQQRAKLEQLEEELRQSRKAVLGVVESVFSPILAGLTVLEKETGISANTMNSQNVMSNRAARAKQVDGKETQLQDEVDFVTNAHNVTECLVCMGNSAQAILVLAPEKAAIDFNTSDFRLNFPLCRGANSSRCFSSSVLCWSCALQLKRRGIDLYRQPVAAAVPCISLKFKPNLQLVYRSICSVMVGGLDLGIPIFLQFLSLCVTELEREDIRTYLFDSLEFLIKEISSNIRTSPFFDAGPEAKVCISEALVNVGLPQVCSRQPFDALHAMTAIGKIVLPPKQKHIILECEQQVLQRGFERHILQLFLTCMLNDQSDKLLSGIAGEMFEYDPKDPTAPCSSRVKLLQFTQFEAVCANAHVKLVISPPERAFACTQVPPTILTRALAFLFTMQTHTSLTTAEQNYVKWCGSAAAAAPSAASIGSLLFKPRPGDAFVDSGWEPSTTIYGPSIYFACNKLEVLGDKRKLLRFHSNESRLAYLRELGNTECNRARVIRDAVLHWCVAGHTTCVSSPAQLRDLWRVVVLRVAEAARPRCTFWTSDMMDVWRWAVCDILYLLATQNHKYGDLERFLFRADFASREAEERRILKCPLNTNQLNDQRLMAQYQDCCHRRQNIESHPAVAPWCEILFREKATLIDEGTRVAILKHLLS